MRILLVEDDKMIGEALCIALRDAAYAVDWVQDGEMALRTIGNQEHQAVLLDLGLPKHDGLEVLKKLRSNGGTLPVIIMTARDGVEDRVTGLDMGADDYLVKPFEMSELLARLRAMLRRQGGQAASLLSNGILSLNPATREAAMGNKNCILSA
ncbi:MAG: response regulator, partial [Gallionella sp.]